MKLIISKTAYAQGYGTDWYRQVSGFSKEERESCQRRWETEKQMSFEEKNRLYYDKELDNPSEVVIMEGCPSCQDVTIRQVVAKKMGSRGWIYDHRMPNQKMINAYCEAREGKE